MLCNMGDTGSTAPFSLIEESIETRMQYLRDIHGLANCSSGDDTQIESCKSRRSSEISEEEPPEENSASECHGRRIDGSPAIAATSLLPAVSTTSSPPIPFPTSTAPAPSVFEAGQERYIGPDLDRVLEDHYRNRPQYLRLLHNEINDSAAQQLPEVVSAPASASASNPYIRNFVARPGPLLDAGPPRLWTGSLSPIMVMETASYNRQRGLMHPQVESDDGGEQDSSRSDNLREQSVHCTSRKPFRFLDLPPEIRDLVYSYVLQPRRKLLHEAYHTYIYELSILRTCTQILTEARRRFRLQNIFVRIETPWHQAEQHASVDGRVPILATGEVADRFDAHHFQIMIEAPEMMHNGGLSKFVIRLEDLEKFCRMWYYSDLTHIGLNNHLALMIVVPHPESLFPGLSSDAIRKHHRLKWAQEELFRPFGMIKDLYDVKVEGCYDTDIQQRMRDEMAIPYDTPEQCLEEAERLKNIGNEELKQGRYESALEHYTKAFGSIHILVDGRHRRICGDAYFEKDLQEGVYKGQHGGIARMVMRIKLVANVIQACLKLERWEDAHFWGMRSINLMREALGGAADTPRPAFPAAAEWGKIYYRTGIAAKKLDHMSDAREMFKLADLWLPNNAMVQKEVAATALRLG